MSRALLIIVALASAGVVASTGFSQDLPDTTEPVTRLPGSWKTDISIDKLELPGATPEVKTAMVALMKALSASEVCLTPTQAAKGDSVDQFLSGQNRRECTFAKRVVAGSTIDIEAICKRAGNEMNMIIKGTKDPKKTDAVIQISGESPQGPMAMEMRAVSTWTCECKPGQKTADDKPVT